MHADLDSARFPAGFPSKDHETEMRKRSYDHLKPAKTIRSAAPECARATAGSLQAVAAHQEYRASIVEIAVWCYPTVWLDNAILASWTPTLANAIPHLLREEGQFEMQFW